MEGLTIDKINTLQAENYRLRKELEKANKALLQAENQYNKVVEQNQELQKAYNELEERLSGKTFFCENCEKLARENEKLKEALKEIRDYLNTLSSVDSDFPNTETYLRIQDKIGEVLNEGK